jgi:hypothetical protein
MTAQVAVLNTKGVALASDSAVTISDGNGPARSYPSAEKIFPVEEMPLAVLHSGSAELQGVPWQILVEMWSQQREHVQRESMSTYADEFSAWLVGQPALVTQEAQDDFYRYLFRDFLLAVRGRIRQELGAEQEMGPGYAEGAARESVNAIVEDYVRVLRERPVFPGMAKVDAPALRRRLAAELKQELDWIFDDTPRTAELDAQADVLAELLVTRCESFASDAVLAFVGYGRDDYFPSVHRTTVSGILEGIVRVHGQSDAEVTSRNRVSITPFGLTEAIQAFLRGTSPEYRTRAHEVLADYVAEDAVKGPGEASERAHQRLDAEFDELEWKRFLGPMLDTVETFPMVEMLRLADSLVGLASLRQLIQGQSSVGGPIDLAKVTKSGGFEWVRNKRHRAIDSLAT